MVVCVLPECMVVGDVLIECGVLMDCMHVVPDILIECMHAGVHLEKLSRGAKVAG